MNATIGIYENHDLAIDAVIKLRDSGYPISEITLMGLLGKEQFDEEMHVAQVNPIKPAGLGFGTIIGTTLGVLTGVGIFAIPGVGFLYGAGALIGAIGGFDFGLIAGGFVAVLTTLGVKDEIAKQYHDTLVEGKILVIAHGKEKDVNRAKEILHEHGTYLGLKLH